VLLLALETATSTCGVALLHNDSVLAETHLHRPRVHAERLTPLADALLAQADTAPGALDAVAVSMGPGSYTGLRIGVSTAKGWALATDAELVGVPTLAAYAARLRPIATPGDVVCALLEARQDEVYAGAFRVSPDGMREHASTTVLPVDALSRWVGGVDGWLWLVGDGAPKARDAFAEVGTGQTRVPHEALPPSAPWVARRGRRRLATQGADDVAGFEPLYVKDVHATPVPSPFS